MNGDDDDDEVGGRRIRSDREELPEDQRLPERLGPQGHLGNHEPVAEMRKAS